MEEESLGYTLPRASSGRHFQLVDEQVHTAAAADVHLPVAVANGNCNRLYTFAVQHDAAMAMPGVRRSNRVEYEYTPSRDNHDHPLMIRIDGHVHVHWDKNTA